MFCSILEQKINYNTLNKNIIFYRDEHDTYPYLFMNRSTISSLAADAKPELQFTATCKMSGDTIGLYKGCPVYCKNDLQDGEVELR